MDVISGELITGTQLRRTSSEKHLICAKSNAYSGLILGSMGKRKMLEYRARQPLFVRCFNKTGDVLLILRSVCVTILAS